MTKGDLFRLLLLAALWGAVFMLARVIAPSLGPVVTAEVRTALASLALVSYVALANSNLQLRKFWRFYGCVGFINTGLPFVLTAYSALYIPAAYVAFLNALSPLFGAVISAFWLQERLSARLLLGLFIGLVGVGTLVGFGPIKLTPEVWAAIASGLSAALCYGIAGAYMRDRSKEAPPLGIATGSQVAASLFLIPFIPLSPILIEPSTTVILASIFAGVFCGALAYLLYYRLIRDIGPTKALTVTFLVPVFAMIFGYLFLKEPVTVSMVIGCVLIFLGTSLVLEMRFMGRLLGNERVAH